MATSSQSVSHPPCTIHQPSGPTSGCGHCQNRSNGSTKTYSQNVQLVSFCGTKQDVYPLHTHTVTRTSPANLLSIQIRTGLLETDRVDNKCPTEVKINKSRWAPHGNAFCDVWYLSEGGGRIGVDYIDVSEPLLALLVHLPSPTCALASTEMCFLFGVSLLFLCNQSGKIY